MVVCFYYLFSALIAAVDFAYLKLWNFSVVVYTKKKKEKRREREKIKKKAYLNLKYLETNLRKITSSNKICIGCSNLSTYFFKI